ncbi:hypothetical protein J5J83_03105 [Azoarcus sp. L1K30]|uniref:hypothetical protein n=1 Tax=Azoarcus sp. L1K30 TaxID=2820277 RepID=UPI001B83378B|nr:hypothetical protein [Azoarcus sp. L1K30]MBR0565104.1 hypothetical protein [Azoarcus sp. L1K30]
MRQAIVSAIQNKQVLAFSYNGIARVVEPHAVGVSTAGNDVLRCFQVQGAHIKPGHDWDLCDLSKIVGLKPTGAMFVAARPGYRRGDKGMVHIYAEL